MSHKWQVIDDFSIWILNTSSWCTHELIKSTRLQAESWERSGMCDITHAWDAIFINQMQSEEQLHYSWQGCFIHNMQFIVHKQQLKSFGMHITVHLNH